VPLLGVALQVPHGCWRHRLPPHRLTLLPQQDQALVRVQVDRAQGQRPTPTARRLGVLREFEIFYNEHRPHQGIANARPLAPLPEPIIDPRRLAHLNIHRRDRLGGILYEYEHAA
jgi:hypothetical protein